MRWAPNIRTYGDAGRYSCRHAAAQMTAAIQIVVSQNHLPSNILAVSPNGLQTICILSALFTKVTDNKQALDRLLCTSSNEPLECSFLSGMRHKPICFPPCEKK